jgi:serine/threonine protein kinase
MLEAKLTDFGLSTLVDPRQENGGCKVFVGTDDHMAPEIISLRANPEWHEGEGKKHKDKIVKNGFWDAKVDVWALGCMMYFFFMGHTPFDADPE